MIPRYARPEMTACWTDASRFKAMAQVEAAALQATIACGQIDMPPAEVQPVLKACTHPYDEERILRIREIEAECRHETVAFVKELQERAGEFGRFLHYGLTSSDVLDTALALQLTDASRRLEATLIRVITSLGGRAKAASDRVMIGRSHGMHAEPMAVAHKFLHHKAEFLRCLQRLQQARKNVSYAKLSGPVGNHRIFSRQAEAHVAKILGLEVEWIANQIIPRDRHAGLVFAIVMIACAIERLTLEIRHLARSEVAEVREAFAKGQRGSSAMPHKRNPILSENLSGLSRYMRTQMAPALENMLLWHERDMSHSSVERILFPDLFVLADFSLARLANLIDDLDIDYDRMEKHATSSVQDSQVLLSRLVEGGMPRDRAWQAVHDICVEATTQGRSIWELAAEHGDLRNQITLDLRRPEHQKGTDKASFRRTLSGETQFMADHLRTIETALGIQSTLDVS